MGICELCGSNTELPLLRERIECVLREGGLTIPEFVQLNPIEDRKSTRLNSSH